MALSFTTSMNAMTFCGWPSKRSEDSSWEAMLKSLQPLSVLMSRIVPNGDMAKTGAAMMGTCCTGLDAREDALVVLLVAIQLLKEV